MSVTVSKADGVTVLTLTSDPESPWPPLCQIFKNLCYSPVCCSVSQHLRGLNRTSQTVLGTLQIMVGLFNIGLGAILHSSHSGSWWLLWSSGVPYWFGVLCILFGVVCILSEKYPSPCLIITTVILNLAGVLLAISVIVIYSIHLSDIVYPWWGWNCNLDYSDYRYWQHTTRSPSLEERVIQKKCWEGRDVVMMLLRSINAVLIVLSALGLCVSISSVVLGIKTLRNKEKGQNKSTGDPEHYKPLVEDAITQHTA